VSGKVVAIRKDKMIAKSANPYNIWSSFVFPLSPNGGEGRVRGK
jgi:hypothetical protein